MVTRLRCVILFLCSILLLPHAGQADKYALLVGIDDYESEDISDLNFAVADVKSFGDALVRNLRFSRDNVKVMTSDLGRGPLYPTDNNLLRQLDILSNNIKPEDTFIFYFSGHGFQRPEAHFLATVNADPFNITTLKKSAISIADLKEAMARIQARQVVFVLDACRNDPAKGRGDAANKMSLKFAKDLQEIAGDTGAGQAGSATLLACSQGQRAWEWPEKRHGVFTYYLLEGIKGAAAERNGELTAVGLCTYVQEQVGQWSRAHRAQAEWQTPDFQMAGAARMVLGKVSAAPPEPDPVPDAVVEEVKTNAQIKVTSDPPGAKVFVGGVEQVGKLTPCVIEVDLGFEQSLAAEVGVAQAGYKSGLRLVRLSRGQTATVSLTLEKSTAREEAAPTPVVAKPTVRFDGVYVSSPYLANTGWICYQKFYADGTLRGYSRVGERDINWINQKIAEDGHPDKYTADEKGLHWEWNHSGKKYRAEATLVDNYITIVYYCNGVLDPSLNKYNNKFVFLPSK